MPEEEELYNITGMNRKRERGSTDCECRNDYGSAKCGTIRIIIWLPRRKTEYFENVRQLDFMNRRIETGYAGQ